ncbi:hypothetical protein E3N88_09024 [Mikania micrantha]|uniref:Uncharacterized protein n=1 Tax=Mikania micrantha TaxID=192012 RepID=A0A5N6PIV6_9ASTR|nr:hypothetical protein E3N88_09024 [Mikania micrantha]
MCMDLNENREPKSVTRSERKGMVWLDINERQAGGGARRSWVVAGDAPGRAGIVAGREAGSLFSLFFHPIG